MVNWTRVFTVLAPVAVVVLETVINCMLSMIQPACDSCLMVYYVAVPQVNLVLLVSCG